LRGIIRSGPERRFAMTVLSLDRQKLGMLANVEGYASLDDLLEAAALDSVSPAICVNPDNPQCNYSCEMEPDQDRGWCEECSRNTMKSALVLAGII
jgi:hypothetical protein